MTEEHQNPDDAQKRYEIYLKEREELLKREVSNTENFDKAILTLSNAGLGFSLLLIYNNNNQLVTACCKWLLGVSLGMFVLAVVFTLISYPFGQRGIKRRVELNERIYVKNEKEARSEGNLPAQITKWLSPVSVVAYVLAVCSMVLFILLNTLK